MRRNWLAATLVVLGVAACARDIKKLMPTPQLYAAGGMNAFSGEDAEYTVFFATDRNEVETDRLDKRFGNDRGEGLHVGRARIRVGAPDEDWASVQQDSLAGKPLPLSFVEVEDYGLLAGTYWEKGVDRAGEWSEKARAPGRKFYEAVNRELERTGSKRIVFYVTGFNANFSWPIQMAAQWTHFTARDALWITYCWASSDSSFAYVQDAVTSGLAVRRLRELLLGLGRHTNAKEIDVIAYSFGAIIVSDSLVEMRLMHYGENAGQLRRLKIGNVYYVAPDEDLEMFRNSYLDRVEDLSLSTQVYISESDGALGLSRALYAKRPRLGRSIKDLTADDRRSLAKETTGGLIECSYAQSRAGKGKSGHGYWYQNPWVSGDIAYSLRTRKPPGERGLVRMPDGAIWTFPEDYPERLAKLTSR
ncbi:MAG: alpha/beta hydrolase [Planctomycetota bacterium]|jgi:esterase/lipase superfamily enzyme